MAKISKNLGTAIACWAVALVFAITGICLSIVIPSSAAEEKTHKIRFFNNGVLVDTQYVKDGENITTPNSIRGNIVTLGGLPYQYNGWSTDEETAAAYFLTATADTDYFASYSLKSIEKVFNISIKDEDYVWHTSDAIYYSNKNEQYKLNLATDTFEPITWQGLSSILGDYIWYAGDDVYYSLNSDQYKLNQATSTWEPVKWNISIQGYNVKNLGGTAYSIPSDTNYIHKLDQANNTWEKVTWNGMDNNIFWQAPDFWSVGDVIYYSHDDDQYKLNATTNTFEKINWQVQPLVFRGRHIWNIGDTYYYSEGNYKLNQAASTWQSGASFFPQYCNIIKIGNIYYAFSGSRDRLYKLDYSVGTEAFCITANNTLTEFSYDSETHPVLDGEAHDNVYYYLTNKKVAPAASEMGSTAIPTVTAYDKYYIYCRCEVNGYYTEWQYLGAAQMSCEHLTFEWIVDKKPTLQSTGHRYSVCTTCGEQLQEETMPKLEKCKDNEHVWGAWIVDTEPTTTSEGRQHRECVVCTWTQTGTIDKLPTYDGRLAVTINGKTEQYTNVKAAFSAISAAEEAAEGMVVQIRVQLLSDINAEEVSFSNFGDCVFDLNGYVFLADSFVFQTAGKLNIIDSRPMVKHYCRFDESSGRYVFTTDEKKLGHAQGDEVLGGVIAANNGGQLLSLGYYRNSALVIDGGTILGDGMVMIQNNPAGDVTAKLVLNNGYLELCTKVQDGDIKEGFSGNVAIMNYFGEIEINGGKIYGEIVSVDDLMVKMQKAVYAALANGDLNEGDMEDKSVMIEYLVARGFDRADVERMMSEDASDMLIIVDMENPQTDSVKINKDVEIRPQYHEDGSLHYYEAVNKNAQAAGQSANDNNSLIALIVLGAAAAVMVVGVAVIIMLNAKRRKKVA